MTEPIVSPQALRGDNPLRPVGLLNLGLALTRGLAGAYLVASSSEMLRDVLGAQVASLPPLVLVQIGSGLVGCLLLLSAFGRATHAVGQLGALLIPPRAPADFSDTKEQVAIALQRQEMPAYRLPESPQFRLAHRMFPQVFPLLTLRVREQLEAALSSGMGAIRWTLLVLAASWAANSLPHGFPSYLVPGIPLGFLAGSLIAAGARILFVYAQFPKTAPSAERDEFRTTMAGGGDPKQIPIGLEHELMSFRASTGAPNRGTRFGFELAEGGVRDSGEFEGMLVVETQPSVRTERAIPMLPMLFAATLGVTIIALVLLVNRPYYLTLLDGSIADDVGGLVLARWLLRVVGAAMLLGEASALVLHAENFLGVFGFVSTAIAIRVSGTYGRAGIKVGKGIYDSIESENLVLRSDSSVVGYVARIESESEGLMGARHITAMRANSAVVEVRRLVERWFTDFHSRGADIVGLDMSSEKVAQMVNANVAIDAKRSGARESAKANARQSASLDRARHTPLLEFNGATAHDSSGTDDIDLSADGTNRASAGTSPEDQTCPDCAEVIKRAARKCRYCGYRLGSE